MEKALAIFEKTEEGTKSVFFDQETIECARLNLRTKKRVAEFQEAQSKTERENRKAEKARERFKAYTKKTMSVVGCECAAVVSLAWAGAAELVHPAVFITVGLLLLCGACVRMGAWFGKAAQR